MTSLSEADWNLLQNHIGQVIVEVEVVPSQQSVEDENYIPLSVFDSGRTEFQKKLGSLQEKYQVGSETRTLILMHQKEVNFKYCISCGSTYAEGSEDCCGNMILYVPEPSPDEINHVIFHGGCQDGHGSHWAAHRPLCMSKGHNKAMETIGYFGARHEKRKARDVHKENNIINMCKGKNVLIADFAFDKNLTREIKKVCNKYILLDHHNSNKTTLEGEPNCYFDENHSGAWLTHAYMVTGVPLAEVETAPKLIRYIQDRDLWRFTEPNSKEIGAAIYVDGGNRIENFDTIDANEKESFKMLLERGTHYLKYQNSVVDRGITGSAYIKRLFGYPTVVCNTSISPSEAGAQLLHTEKFKDCRIAAVWHWEDGLFKFHLRRRVHDDDIDLGALCKLNFSAGGHPAAAGFTVADTVGIAFVFKYYGNSLQVEEISPTVA
jgi:hypothetical protein